MANFSLLTTLTLNAAGFNSGIQKATKQSKALSTGVKEAGNSMKNSFSGIIDQITPLNSNMNLFLDSIIGGAGAFKAMIPAISGVKTALITSGIGALIVGVGVAIGGLIAWTKRTDQGSDNWRLFCDIIKVATDSLLDRLAVLGGAMFKLFKGDFSGAWQDITKAFTGWKEGAEKAFKATFELNQLQDDLENKQEVYATKRANLEVQISELQLKARDEESYSAKERLDFNEKLKQKIQELYALDASLKNQELAVLKKEMSMQQTNQDNRQKVNEKEAELIKLRAEYNGNLRETLKLNNKLAEGVKEEIEFEKAKNALHNELLGNPVNLAINKEVSISTKKNDNPIDELKKYNNELNKLQSNNYLNSQLTVWDNLGESINKSQILLELFQIGIGGLSDALVNLAENGQSSFKDMITGMIDGLRKLLVGLLAQSIGNLFASGTKKGLLGMVGAVAGISVLLGLWKSKVPKFATGGIVGGISYTGDHQLAAVNSGEMILNRNQQSNLFKQLNNGGGNGGEVTFRIQGTQLVGVLSNYNNQLNRIK